MIVHELLPPAVPCYFTGRETELGLLETAFCQQNTILISGIGGIGKTSLAAKFADYLVKSDNEKTVLWLTIQEQWDEETFLKNIFDASKDIFYLLDKPMEDSIQTSTMLLQLVEKHKARLFIDDCHRLPDEVVSLFIEKSTSLLKDGRLILISRTLPSIPPHQLIDISFKPLQGLSTNDCLTLIEQYCSKMRFNNPDTHELEQVITSLAGHPLAIKLFLSQLFYTEESPGLIADSQDFHSLMDETLVNDILNHLTEQELTVLKILSLCRIPVHQELLAELNIPKTTIKYLENKLLVNSGKGNLSTHDLIKSHVKAKISESDAKQLHEKIGFFYSRTEIASISNFSELFYHYEKSHKLPDLIDQYLRQIELMTLNQDDTFILLDSFVDKLVSFNLPYKKEELQFHQIDYYCMKKNIGKVTELINLFPTRQKDFLYLKARHKYIQGSFVEASELFQKCKQEGFGKAILLNTHLYSCQCYTMLHELKCAQNELEEINRCITNPSPQLSAKVTRLKAQISEYQGLLKPALELYQTAQQFYFEKDRLGALEEITTSMCRIYLKLDDFQEAKHCFEQLEVINHKLNNEHSWFYYYNSLGHFYSQKSDFKKCIEMKAKAAQIASSNYWHYEHLSCLQNILKSHLELEQYKSAMECIAQCEELLEQIDAPAEEAYIKITHAAILLLSANTHAARHILNQCQKLVFDTPKSLKSRYRCKDLKLTFYMVNENCLKLEKQYGLADEEQKNFDSELNSLSEEEQEAFFNDAQWYLKNTNANVKHNISSNVMSCSSISSVELKHLYESTRAICFIYNGKQKFLSFMGDKLNISSHPTAIKILDILVKSPGEIFSRNEIIKEIWNKKIPIESDYNNLRVQIHKLRKLLNSDTELILQKENGYQFNTSILYCVIY
jgi:DNA-binding winged helix-turn-helix (wHTH) protein/tetratricopeptide (TPR) repeat protein